MDQGPGCGQHPHSKPQVSTGSPKGVLCFWREGGKWPWGGTTFNRALRTLVGVPNSIQVDTSELRTYCVIEGTVRLFTLIIGVELT